MPMKVRPKRAMRCLAGASVVEVTRGWSAGSIAATLLVDVGARCRKMVLPPERQDLAPDDEIGVWRARLDMAQRRGKEAIEVAVDADVLPWIANADFLVVDVDGHRFLGGSSGWRTIRKRYPNLIMCAATPFGMSGPLSGSAATELTVEAATGILSITGQEDGAPTRAGFPVGHQATALHLVTAALATYWCRTRTGERTEVIDGALFDSLFSFLSTFLADHVQGRNAPSRFGNRHPLLAPWNTYPTRDGQVVICVSTDVVWQRLFDLMEPAEMGREARGWSTVERLERRSSVDAAAAGWTSDRTTEQAIAELKAAGVPCGPLFGLAEMLRDEIVRSRELIIEDAAHGAQANLPFLCQPL